MLAQPIRAQRLRHQNCIIKVCETKIVDIGRASGVDRQKTLSDTKFLNFLLLQSLLSGKRIEEAEVESEKNVVWQDKVARTLVAIMKLKMKRVEFTALISSQSRSHTVHPTASSDLPDNEMDRVVVVFPLWRNQWSRWCFS